MSKPLVALPPPPPAPAEPDWAAFVALDWGDQKHTWSLAVAGVPQYERGTLEQKPEAVEAWAVELSRRFANRPIAVCLEQAQGALVFLLMKYAQLVLYPVHPATSARYREAFYPSGAKDDPVDADLLMEILLHHRERLRRLDPDTTETRTLQSLVQDRRALVNERTRQKNRLTARLKLYYPQVLEWFEDVASPLVLDLLQQWPTVEALQGNHPGTLRRFFHQHNCRSEKRLQERLEQLYHAVPALQDAAVVRPSVLMVQSLVGVLQTLNRRIAILDQEIAAVAACHPEFGLFQSLPGAGPALVPRLIAAFGTRREHYAHADEVACYSGIAPVTKRSGNTQVALMRRACPKFLRQTFHEFAAHSLAKSAWAHAFYDLQREHGLEHHAAVRSLAYKWIRVIYACWKHHTPYDEQRYLEALRRRKSPCLPALAPLADPTRIGWKPVAGFSKLSQQNS